MMNRIEPALFATVESTAGVMRMLSNASRLRIVIALLNIEQSVATLEATLGIKQPNLSQQLAELRKGGVLKARRSAKSVFYSIADSRVRDIVALLASSLNTSTRHAGASRVTDETLARGRCSEAAQFAQVWPPLDGANGQRFK
jgi:DNA-binding transcriptional ArsR family regulator